MSIGATENIGPRVDVTNLTPKNIGPRAGTPPTSTEIGNRAFSVRNWSGRRLPPKFSVPGPVQPAQPPTASADSRFWP